MITDAYKRAPSCLTKYNRTLVPHTLDIDLNWLTSFHLPLHSFNFLLFQRQIGALLIFLLLPLGFLSPSYTGMHTVHALLAFACSLGSGCYPTSPLCDLKPTVRQIMVIWCRSTCKHTQSRILLHTLTACVKTGAWAFVLLRNDTCCL